MGFLDPDIPESGYKGSVPKYTSTRRAVDNSAQTERRPGQGGRRYFSDTIYSNMDGADQGNQTTTMIPRGTTTSAIAQAERQADFLKAEQDARFAEGDAPSYGTPDYGVSPYDDGVRAYGAPHKNNSGYSGQPGYREAGDVTSTAGYRGQPGYREAGDVTSSPNMGAGSGYREEGDITSSPNMGAGSGYRGGRFDEPSITEDEPYRAGGYREDGDTTSSNDLPETPRYAQGGIAQFGAGSGYRGASSPMPRSPFRRGQPAPSYGAGSGYRGVPGRTGQEGMFGMRTGPNGNMIAGSGYRGVPGRTGQEGIFGITDALRRSRAGNRSPQVINDIPPISGQRPPGQPPKYIMPPISGQRPPGQPNRNISVTDELRRAAGPDFLNGPNKGIVADNHGEMVRRREQMEKYKREMNEKRNTSENNKRLEDLLNGDGGKAPVNRQRPSGPMRNKGRRRRSDGTTSEVDFGGITDALRRSRAGNRSPQIRNDIPPSMPKNNGVPMQLEQRMRGFRGFAEGGIAQTSPGQGYYLGGATDGMADEIVSTIDGEVEARLSDGEYVIPADVVSHLGNGNSAAGADKLGKMMDNVRKERTGNKEQGKKIDADKVINKMAGGTAQFNTGGEVTTGAESSISPYAGDYVVDMLGKGAAAADTPYQAYTGPLTAGASELQQQAFRGVGSLQTPGAMGGQGYQAGTFDSAAQQQYMNPYLQGSLNPQLRENRREAEIQRIQDAGRLTKAGAFGGSRQAIMEAEGARNLLQSQADITARGYDTAFQQAQKQFNTEQDRGMTAQDKTNKFGFDVLTAQRNAGDTQRAIEAEGIAADKGQFEEERDYAQKQIQFQKSLLEGLPLESQSKQFMGPSDLAQLSAILSAGGSLYDMYDKYTGGSDGGGGGDSFKYEDYDDAFDTDQGKDYEEVEGGGNSEIYRDPLGI